MSDIASRGKDSVLLINQSTITEADGVDLVSESMVNSHETYEGDADSLHGGRQRDGEDAIVVAEKPSGSFSYRPRYTELSELLELALGGGSDTAWIPLETGDLDTFNIEVQHSDALAESYAGCVVNELVLRSEQNSPLVAMVTLLAASAAIEATPETPTYAGVGGVAPIMHNDLVITGDAGITGLKPFNFQLGIKNNLEEDGFANSINRQFMDAEGFDCDLEMEVKLTLELGTYLNTWNTTSPKPMLEIVATYSSGDLSMAITFQGILSSDPPKIENAGRQKYTMQFSGRAIWGGSPRAITSHMVSIAIVDA